MELVVACCLGVELRRDQIEIRKNKLSEKEKAESDEIAKKCFLEILASWLAAR